MPGNTTCLKIVRSRGTHGQLRPQLAATTFHGPVTLAESIVFFQETLDGCAATFARHDFFRLELQLRGDRTRAFLQRGMLALDPVDSMDATFQQDGVPPGFSFSSSFRRPGTKPTGNNSRPRSLSRAPWALTFSP